MTQKPISIMEEDWDHLIILDACRYDYFEKIYKDYLGGKLRKVISPASHTKEWIKKVFRGKYNDVVYVSANPLINSMGVGDFDARKHFHKVIDVWDHGWDKKIEMVPPENVNKATLRARDDYPDKRLIIHYAQPHGPYLSLGASEKRGAPFQRLGAWVGKFLERKFRKFVGRALEKFFGRTPILWKIRGILGQRPLTPEEVAFREGKGSLHQAYEKNLKIALIYVAKLVKELPGKIVITADHGECLGEEGRYNHEPELHIPALVEVPWLEVKGGGEISTFVEKRRIKNRIQKLKREGKV
jgi:hypothetical protein